MAYYTRTNSRSREIVDGIFSSIVLFGIGSAIFRQFGLEGLAITVIGICGIFGIFLVFLQYGKYKAARARCKHGVVGAALNGYKLCIKCQWEKEAEEQIARKRAEEEEARRKAEKERAYKEWVAKIRLPEYLTKMDPEEFEHLVCDLFRKMGYEVEHTPYSGDGGVDGYLKKNGDLSILQCKRVQGSVGEPILRDLFGTMHAKGAKEGVVVTTGKVSQKARDWASNKPIRILEIGEIVNHIRTHYREDEVVPESFIPDHKKNSTCPKCSGPLKVVNWKGRRFLGCSAYPSCRYTKGL